MARKNSAISASTRESVQWLRSVQYPRGMRNYGEVMWLVAGACANSVDGAEIETEDGTEIEFGLSETFEVPHLSTECYFNDSFRNDFGEFHMNPYWAPHVLSSLLKLSIIVYMQNNSSPYPALTMTTFDYKQ